MLAQTRDEDLQDQGKLGKDTLTVSKERANLFLYQPLEVHFPLGTV